MYTERGCILNYAIIYTARQFLRLQYVFKGDIKSLFETRDSIGILIRPGTNPFI